FLAQALEVIGAERGVLPAAEALDEGGAGEGLVGADRAGDRLLGVRGAGELVVGIDAVAAEIGIVADPAALEPGPPGLVDVVARDAQDVAAVLLLGGVVAVLVLALDAGEAAGRGEGAVHEALAIFRRKGAALLGRDHRLEREVLVRAERDEIRLAYQEAELGIAAEDRRHQA